MHLHAPGEHIDDPRKLAETQDLLFWDVGDVRLTEKGEHVVFAKRVELDVFDHNHFTPLRTEHRVVDHSLDIGVVPTRQKAQRALDSLRGLYETLSLDILSQADDQVADEVIETGITDFIEFQVGRPVSVREALLNGINHPTQVHFCVVSHHYPFLRQTTSRQA